MKTYAALTMIVLSLASFGCATPSPLALQSTALSPPPAEVMVPRDANFRERLLRFFSTLPTKPTP